MGKATSWYTVVAGALLTYVPYRYVTTAWVNVWSRDLHSPR